MEPPNFREIGENDLNLTPPQNDEGDCESCIHFKEEDGIKLCEKFGVHVMIPIRPYIGTTEVRTTCDFYYVTFKRDPFRWFTDLQGTLNDIKNHDKEIMESLNWKYRIPLKTIYAKLSIDKHDFSEILKSLPPDIYKVTKWELFIDNHYRAYFLYHFDIYYKRYCANKRN